MPVDLERFLRRAQRAPTALRNAVRRVAQRHRSTLLAEARRQAPRRTGALQRSLRASTKTAGSGAKVAVRSDHPAARELEQGGTKSGDPWLAVPVRDDVRHLDTPRRDVRLVSVQGRDGRVFLASAARGDIRWRLVRRVRIARNPFISRAVDKHSLPLQRALLRKLDEGTR